MGAGSGFFTFRDWSREDATFSYRLGVVTAANLAGNGGVLDRVGTLKNALNAITLGQIVGEGLSVYNNKYPLTDSLSKNAQRETKWLVTYADNTEFFDVAQAIPNDAYGRVFTAEIPTADASLLPTGVPGDEADIVSAGAIKTFVDEFEATCKSPAGGTPKVLSVKLVGRNL